jgi:hypothetical protein
MYLIYAVAFCHLMNRLLEGYSSTVISLDQKEENGYTHKESFLTLETYETDIKSALHSITWWLSTAHER